VQDKVFLMDQENNDHSEPYDPTLELSSFKPPVLELLLEYPDEKIQIDRTEVEANKDQIIETLLNYKIEITKIRATIGPTVTLYEIIPKPGIRISRIKNLEDDIALSLSALGIRIIAPIPGKGTIGIEVPNKKKQIVSLKEVLSSDKFISGKMDLPIALGKTISNEVFVADLTKMPHLLIAGATGQGKSVGINTVLMSLLYRKHPSQLKLVLIDPKKVELFPYAKLANHFLAFLPDQKEPIVTETKKVIYTLNSLCIEMDDRYDLLKKAHARNLKEYNEKFVNRQLNPLKGHKFMPFIVLVIDEFADLIMTAGKEVEMPIARLAQLARAVGIHLIIATQRPSVNIITGVIKANFPARLAYKVASKVDSRTILDMGGADQLIGQGDMLLSIGSNMIRLQCAFVDTPEVESVINHIADQKGYPEPYYLPEFMGDDEPIAGADGMTYAELDDMFEDAARLVVQNQHGSTSMIQRRLKLGYNRAGRIMDQLQAVGVVGPAEGSKPRDVLMYTETDLDMLISRMRTKN
jgi:S-DNA-T family DNA segregation ATPase FtsK/SpoIIIE